MEFPSFITAVSSSRKKPRTQKLLLFLLVSCLCSACNLTEQYIRKSEKAYEKLGTETAFIETDSSKVFLRRVGKSDKKLVLIHGFGPLPQVQWEDLTKELSGEFELIIPDLIYFGKSTSSYGVHSIQFQAREMARAIRKTGITDYYIAGLSYGGMVSALVAHNNPDNVKGLILIDALSKFSDRSYTDSLARAKGAAEAADFLLPQNGKAMKRLFSATYYKPPKYPAFLLNKPAQVLYSDDENHKRSMIHHLKDNEESLKSWDTTYKGPVQIIWGDSDILIPSHNARLLNDYYPDSRIHIIEKSGHVPNIENSKEVAEVITSFVMQKKNK